MGKHKLSKIFFYSLALSLVYSIFIFSSAHAIGVSPSKIVVENLRQDSIVKKEVHISRSDAFRKDYYIVEKSGTGSDYIELSKNFLILEKGEQKTFFSLYIKPADADEGRYVAFVLLVPDLSKYGDSQSVGMQSSVGFSVEFSVIKGEYSDLAVSEIFVNSDHENDTFNITFNAANKGNTEESIDEVNVFLKNVSTGEVFMKKIESGFVLDPFTEYSFEVPYGEKIEWGIYKAKVQVLSDGAMLGERDEIPVSVNPLGKNSGVKSVKLKYLCLSVLLFVFAALLIALVIKIKTLRLK